MTPQAFGAQLDAQRPHLKAYGQYVIEKIMTLMRANMTAEKFDALFKVTPSFRVKDTASALQKIIRKNYKHPVSEMTDVVGVRFVVLLEADIELVEKAIISCNGVWTPRKDRFPLFEIQENPEAFEYQSTHFVIRLNQDTQIGDFTVLADTPCEVQIRTLVQHAYSEFVHDRVYKPGTHVPTGVRRLVARAMAMLESTDLIFSEAADELECVNLSLDQWMELSATVYNRHCGEHLTNVAEHEARLFFETFRDLLPSANSRDVEVHFQSYAQRITQHRDHQNVFGHPFVVVLMWVVARHDQVVAARWPMGKYRTDLSTVAGLMGIAL
jgi:putative GTP pyrophosphokinase